MSLRFFDSNCSIGMRSVPIRGSFCDVKTLLKRMEICKIEDAMVYHNLAEEYHPKKGNEALMEAIKGYGNLHPVWVVMPNDAGEFYDPDELISLLRKNNVKMVRVFPSKGSHNYSLFLRGSQTLLKALDEHRIPLMIGMDQISYEEISNIASIYNNIPLILTNTGYRADRYLYPLLESFGNIYVETSSYKVHFGIEALCKKFGAERLIFGSGLPLYSAGSAVTMITHLLLPDEDKIKIAGGNLRRLLGGVIYEG